jgi:phage gp46-like protein
MSLFPEVDIRITGECLDLTPLWDTVMDPWEFRGDWRLADPTREPNNIGGLQAHSALHTAITIQLFTDKWSKANEVRDQQDPRGWPLDLIDNQGFPELGSELWTLFRGRLSPETAVLAREYVLMALQTLIDQGVVAEVECQAEALVEDSRLDVHVQCYAASGSTVYETKFKFAWDQTGHISGIIDPADVVDIGGGGAEEGQLDFSDPDNSGLIVLLEDI